MTAFVSPASAVAAVRRTANVSDVTLRKVVRNTLRLAVKAAKSRSYKSLRDGEARIRNEFRGSAREALTAAPVTADNVLAALTPDRSLSRRAGRACAAEKAAVAEFYNTNRSELDAAIEACVADAASLLNSLREDFVAGRFDAPVATPMTADELAAVASADVLNSETSVTVPEVPAAVETA